MLYFRFIVINIILFFSLSLYSQAPGYLGKRLFIEAKVGVNYSFSTDYAHLNEDKYETKGTRITKISVNWAEERHSYISIEATHRQHLDSEYPLISFQGSPELTYQIDIKNIGLGYYKTFYSIAPLGSFIGGKVFYAQAQASPLKYTESGDEFGGSKRIAYDLQYKPPTLDYIGVSFSCGHRTIIYNRFILNYVLNLGKGFFNYNFKPEDNNDKRRYAYSPISLQRYNNFFVNFSIGVGVLLF